MFVVPALLLAMSVSSQAETSLVMTRVDGGMQELRNLCLESEHFDIRKCFFYDGGCEVSGMFFYCEIFKRHILFVVGIGLPLYCLFFNQ